MIWRNGCEQDASSSERVRRPPIGVKVIMEEIVQERGPGQQDAGRKTGRIPAPPQDADEQRPYYGRLALRERVVMNKDGKSSEADGYLLTSAAPSLNDIARNTR